MKNQRICVWKEWQGKATVNLMNYHWSQLYFQMIACSFISYIDYILKFLSIQCRSDMGNWFTLVRLWTGSPGLYYYQTKLPDGEDWLISSIEYRFDHRVSGWQYVWPFRLRPGDQVKTGSNFGQILRVTFVRDTNTVGSTVTRFQLWIVTNVAVTFQRTSQFSSITVRQ